MKHKISRLNLGFVFSLPEIIISDPDFHWCSEIYDPWVRVVCFRPVNTIVSLARILSQCKSLVTCPFFNLCAARSHFCIRWSGGCFGSPQNIASSQIRSKVAIFKGIIESIQTRIIPTALASNVTCVLVFLHLFPHSADRQLRPNSINSQNDLSALFFW